MSLNSLIRTSTISKTFQGDTRTPLKGIEGEGKGGRKWGMGGRGRKERRRWGKEKR
jgi:hypothetical protein